MGGNYSGFQVQSDGHKTVQGEVEGALLSLYNDKVAVTASGRTDEGVHALNQTLHYDEIKEITTKKIQSALNYYLPPDIRVIKAERVSDDFHARHGAKKKTYYYDMYFSSCDDPFLTGRALRINKKLNVKAMKKAAKLFKGVHDFKAFRAFNSDIKTTVRKVFYCRIKKISLMGHRGLRLVICADGFLYKMVRIITGEILNVGENKLTCRQIKGFLDSKKERDKKRTAPPEGLYLAEVEYYEKSEKRIQYSRI